MVLRRPRSPLVCEAVRGKRPGLRNEAQSVPAGLCASGVVADVDLLVGPVLALRAAAFPAFAARWACPGLLPGRLPLCLQTTTNVHAGFARTGITLHVLTCQPHACYTHPEGPCLVDTILQCWQITLGESNRRNVCTFFFAGPAASSSAFGLKLSLSLSLAVVRALLAGCFGLA